MAIQPGRNQLGTDRGHIIVRTGRDGLAATAGHDLTIELTRWSGVLTVTEDLSPGSLEVRIDMRSLLVRDGTGGLKPLTDRDKREAALTAGKVLRTQRSPEAAFSAAEFEPGIAGGGVISGNLTLAGITRPLQLQVSKTGQDAYQATASVVQSHFGIKPYSGFLGALKVRDNVDIEVSIDLSGPTATRELPGGERT